MTIIARDARGHTIQAMRFGPNTTQLFTETHAVVNLANNSNDTRLFRVVASAPCHIEISETPVATINSPLLPAEVIEFIEFGPKDNISVIKNLEAGLDGTIHLTEGK